jgi:hypothetical protein
VGSLREESDEIHKTCFTPRRAKNLGMNTEHRKIADCHPKAELNFRGLK